MHHGLKCMCQRLPHIWACITRGAFLFPLPGTGTPRGRPTTRFGWAIMDLSSYNLTTCMSTRPTIRSRIPLVRGRGGLTCVARCGFGSNRGGGWDGTTGGAAHWQVGGSVGWLVHPHALHPPASLARGPWSQALEMISNTTPTRTHYPASTATDRSAPPCTRQLRVCAATAASKHGRYVRHSPQRQSLQCYVHGWCCGQRDNWMLKRRMG